MRLGVRAALVGGAWRPGDVEVLDGRVAAVGLDADSGFGASLDPRCSGSGSGRITCGPVAVAGFVDVQCNGYAGIDLASDDPEEIVALCGAVARDGVTALAPTLITAEPDASVAALARLDRARALLAGDVTHGGAGHDARPAASRTGGSPSHGSASAAPGTPTARLLGAHLEGPFLSPARLGTHPPVGCRDPDPVLLARLLAAGRVDVVTLAPELPGSSSLVAELARRGVVVSAGHSDADAAAAHEGFDGGITGATHLFNAMSGVDHRAPGLAAVALTRPDVVVTLIADGHHLAPEALRLAASAAAGRWALVTDATAAAGMPDGRYVLGGVPLTLDGGTVRNDAGGLAGSATTLARSVRVAVDAGIDPTDALLAATSTPARLLRRPDLGTLVPGSRADVVVLDADLEVVRVLVDGRDVRT